tara:strand:+ start:542 stop:1447 length:906 start_codon:yes stop_codon:yes gene_type:complete
METKDLKDFSKNIIGKVTFDYDIKNLNWFNIGGKTKVYFKPETLDELIRFLKIYQNRSNIFILGAGSNVLFDDEIYNGTIIKLGKKFSNITLLGENKIIAGASTLDKKLAEFAKENELSGFEFLYSIPGTIGGGIRMNAGCFDSEFKDILISIQLIDFNGNIKTIPADKIDFSYRGNDIPKNYIFLSATFKGIKSNREEIQKKMGILKLKKEKAQPSKIKTGGSTFKNPNNVKKKVWELIKKSVPTDTSFGDAKISEKHCNFFVNRKNATSEDMKKLINFVKKKVKEKTGIELTLEIVLVE